MSELASIPTPDFIAQLLAEEKRIKDQIELARNQSKNQTIDHIKSLMTTYGVTMGDLMGRKGVKASVLYKSPTGETWTGRGKAPKWFSTLLALGHTKESLKVPAATEETVQ